jgi:polyhydroxyalkanoate synthase
MLRDLEQGRLTQVDEGKFTIGENLAVTPGKVVFENKLFQLIQYTPTTEQVYETPLVIFPAWVNKFYILDLTPKNSFVRWAVEQGLTVFMVSWANPDESFADITHDDYVRDGFLTAFDKAREITGSASVNTIGYCVAGAALAGVLGYLAAEGEPDIARSATFLTTQVDYSEPGEIKTFVDEGLLDTAVTLSKDKGYLPGRHLATMFNLLRSNDLIWNYVVNNYMLGKAYQPFDLLYWNSDSTNVPARWLNEFVRDTYIANRLIRPGGVTVLGRPVDLSRVQTPAFAQAGKEDHIAPAASCYKITQALGGPVRFVLAGSGHIAGVVNPPVAQKYQHWTSEATPPTLDEFMAAAVETKGSWWPEWLAWLAPYLGDKVPARVPGDGGAKIIEDAPGRYVKVRA